MALASVGRVSRFSDDHFKCVFLMQNPKWTGTGVVIDIRGDKALFMIPEYCIILYGILKLNYLEIR
jgi:exoribonuclease-2